MRLLISNGELNFNQLAATEIAKQIRRNPDVVLGFATGNTTEGVHYELVRMYENKEIDFSQIHSFNLDEYVGVTRKDLSSCYARMENQLFKHVNIPQKNIHFLDGRASSLENECLNYEEKIKQFGGIDIQILGIGENGHIAFNEPGTPFHSDTHTVDITEDTIQAKASMFGSIQSVPKKGITMGIRNIMHAKKIYLLAKGRSKASILRKTLCGPISNDIPSSILQLHPDLSVIVDEESSTEITGIMKPDGKKEGEKI